MINGDTVRNLLFMFFGFILIVVGMGVAASAKKARMQDVANTGVNVIAAIAIVGLGASSIAWGVFGTSILRTIGIQGV